MNIMFYCATTASLTKLYIEHLELNKLQIDL